MQIFFKVNTDGIISLSVKMARRRIMMNYWPLVREHRRPVVAGNDYLRAEIKQIQQRQSFPQWLVLPVFDKAHGGRVNRWVLCQQGLNVRCEIILKVDAVQHIRNA